MKYLLLIGRILFSLIFLLTITSHFKKETIEYATMQGVPYASFFVPLSAIIAFAGSLCIIFGFKARWGAWLLIVFLIPVTFFMHAFWRESEPMQTKMQMVNFMKNLSLIGASLMITYFGAGPLSMDEKNKSQNNQ